MPPSNVDSPKLTLKSYPITLQLFNLSSLPFLPQVPHRTAFGSHGSIDVITRQEMHPGHMFPDIRGFHDQTTNSSSATEGGTLPREGQTAAAPAPAPAMVAGSGSVISGSSVEESSPKQQKKKSSFFSSNKDKGDKSGSGKEKSIFKKLRPSVKSSSAAAAENVENGSGEESSGGHSNNAGTSSSSRYQFMKFLITVTDFGCSTLCLVLPGLIIWEADGTG